MSLPAEDVLAIRALMVRYSQLVDLDSAPEDEFLALFTEDALIISPQRGRFQGRDAHRAYAYGARHSRYGVGDGTTKAAQVRRVLSNFLIEGDGNQATMQVFVLNFATELLTPPRQTQFFSAGHYECDVRKVDGEWKIARRVLYLDNLSGTPNDKSDRNHTEVPLVIVGS
jgi:hypothetical protein